MTPDQSPTGAVERLEATAAELEAMRERWLMATPDKDHTPWAIVTRAIQTLREVATLRQPTAAPEGWRERAANEIRSAVLSQAQRDEEGPTDDWIEGYVDFDAVASALSSAPPAPVQQGEGWRSPIAVPEAPVGGESYYIVAVKRAHNGKIYSFPATYCNAKELTFEDDNQEVTGWFSAEAVEDDGRTYYPLLTEGDELVAWTNVPQFDALSTPEEPAKESPASYVDREGVRMIVAEALASEPYATADGRGRLDVAVDKLLALFQNRTGAENAQVACPTREEVAREFYLAMYERDYGKWEAVETRDVWLEKADRILALFPTSEGAGR